MLLMNRNRVRLVVVAVVALVGLFVWWLEHDRAQHVDRPPTTESHIAAARMALREIQTAQELHAAENDGRYAASLDTLLALDAELADWLERGVIARIEGDEAGAWYAAEVTHTDVPAWHCLVASDSAPAVIYGGLVPGEQRCGAPPGSDVESADSRS